MTTFTTGRHSGHARQRILDLLTSIGTQTRVLIAEGICRGTLRYRATLFFYEVRRIRETVMEVGTLSPAKLPRELDTLLPLCVGPLARFRMTILRASRMCNGRAVLTGNDRCRSCTAKLKPPLMQCRACGATN